MGVGIKGPKAIAALLKVGGWIGQLAIATATDAHSNKVSAKVGNDCLDILVDQRSQLSVKD